ncbi:MAG: nucleotide exchange factor GrpE [Actinobacteria bacterium]|jgi:molecular chaperone GrpE|nr:nucleotide exchange factor GrpE [Actinomycetota bacterium]
MNEQHGDQDEPVVRDKRRIDPETGEVRAEAEGESTSVDSPDALADDASVTDADSELLDKAADEIAAERLADLQRVSAEYANYRKRTEANRELDRERAVADTVRLLLPVLDDLDRAEKHGDLADGAPLTAIAAKVRGVGERLGLSAYGVAGEVFDPNIHEAIVQQPSADVTVETVLDVAERGYLLGTTQVRPAKVVVAVPNG